jgi:LPXTG-motif cell wall-anchored protein
MRRRSPVVLAAALALGAPAPALAQSVGDEQYRDPFAGEEQAPQDDGAEDTAPASPTPAPAPAPAPAAPTGSAPVEPTATTAGTLPRTGAEAAWVAAAGLLLIAGGLGLRRSART